MNPACSALSIDERPRRAAFTLIEMTIAATLLGVVFAVLGQFLGRWEAARRAADERTFALQTVECVLERIASRPEVVDDLLPVGTDQRLRSPELAIEQAAPDEANLTAVTARLTWRNSEGQQVTPIILTAWIPPKADNEPAGQGSRRVEPGERFAVSGEYATGPNENIPVKGETP